MELLTHIKVLYNKRAGQFHVTAPSDLKPRLEATVHPILGGHLIIVGEIVTERYEAKLKKTGVQVGHRI